MPFLKSLFTLEGKNAIVTGAASGLGQHCAETLARAGARVALLDINQDGLAKTAARIKKIGGQSVSQVVDISQTKAVDAGVGEVIEAFGAIHVLVNSAGVALWRPVLKVTEKEWDLLLDVDLKGTWLMCQAVAKHMIAHKIHGSLINISSATSHRPQPNLVPYATAKAGVNHLSRALAAELAPYGIRVNSLAPGGIMTNMVREFLKTPDGKAAVASVPLKRFAEVEEYNGPLLLLASDASSYMTGAVIMVDGGLACAALQFPEHDQSN